MERRRILVGELFQETNSFNPILMPRSEFRVLSGRAAVEAMRGTNEGLGGIIEVAEQEGIELIVPAVFNVFSAGGPVDHAVYLEAREAIAGAAQTGGFDAIVLSLHGAMTTNELDDPDCDLMMHLRDIVGPDVPITASFDSHGHISPATIAPCDFLTGYKTNPHSDLALTGRRACIAALDILNGTFRPVGCSVHIPMLTLGNDRTDRGPLNSIMLHAENLLASKRLYDVSVFTVQQFLDVPGVGQTVIAYADANIDAARDAADILGRMLWDAREEMIARYRTIESCFELARSEGRSRPVVVGDQGDRIQAGGRGDSTFILSRLLEEGDIAAAVPIRDEVAVAQCLKAGLGSEVSLTLGGRISRETPPVKLMGKIVGVSENADYVFHGPCGEGSKGRTGAYAVVKVGRVTIAVCDGNVSFVDPNEYAAMGIDIGAHQLVVSRSGYHFSLNFDGLGDCIVADTPGITAYRPGELPFSRARPIWPIDDVPYDPRKFIRIRNC